MEPRFLVGIHLGSQGGQKLILNAIYRSLVFPGLGNSGLIALDGICYQLLVLSNSCLDGFLVSGNVFCVLVDSSLKGGLGLFHLLSKKDVGSGKDLVVGLHLFVQRNQLGRNIAFIGLKDEPQRGDLSLIIYIRGLELIIQCLHLRFQVLKVGGFHFLRARNEGQ